MMPGRPSSESRLLTREENNLLFSLLGVKCQSLASGVVQLFLTDPPRHNQWRRKDAGIMCLVKDHTRRSYFFRLYCLSRKALVWENEVYNNLEYTAPRSWLHTFEAESCMAAFNFADGEEAKFFHSEVRRTIANKNQKQIERRARNSHQMEGYQGSTSHAQRHYVHNGPDVRKHQKKGSGNGVKGKDAKRRLKKEDIGLPSDFRHVSHVGWDANRGFEGHGEALEDPLLKEILSKAGVSDNQLLDPATREFIYGFLEEQCGLPSQKNEGAKLPKAPPVPSRAPPPAYPTSKPQQSSPASSLNTRRQILPPATNQRVAPPPPPPPTSSLPKLPDTEKSKNAPAPPAPPPPPPPPPPAMGDPAPPPPPPANRPPANGPADPRTALMEAIKTGTTLKHVDVEKKPVAHMDSRGELLDQIRQGVELKSVQQTEKPNGPSVPLDGIAGALARALAERSRAFHNDSETETESEADGDSDSEWDE